MNRFEFEKLGLLPANGWFDMYELNLIDDSDVERFLLSAYVSREYW